MRKKGAITFRFRCENLGQAQAYWEAMIKESARHAGAIESPTNSLAVHDIVIQFRTDDKALEEVEP